MEMNYVTHKSVCRAVTGGYMLVAMPVDFLDLQKKARPFSPRCPPNRASVPAFTLRSLVGRGGGNWVVDQQIWRDEDAARDTAEVGI